MTWFAPVNILFLVFMSLGILISISASSWPMAWVGLEINLISFIPLIISPMTSKSSNAAVFYFIAQVTGSVMFLLGPTMNQLGIISSPTSSITTSIMIMGLMVKLGSAPAHLWFPAVVGRLPFWTGFLLMTTQKIAPLALCANLMKDMHSTSFIMMLGIINTYLGAHGAYVQSDIRQLLAYSSIAHLGWMICLLPLATAYPLIYLGGYILSLVPIIYHFHPIRATSIKRFSLNTATSKMKTSLMSVLLNLSGLPPFGGFFMKIMALSLLISSGHWFISLHLVLASMLTLSAYSGLVFMSVMSGATTMSVKTVMRSAILYTLMSVPIMVGLPYLMPLFF